MPRPRITARALLRRINWYPPFWAAGIKVLSIADDWSQARVRLKSGRLNRNYVGTHFGGSLFAMCDPFWMILMMERLGPDYIVWDKAGEIDFVKAVREPVYADFCLDPEVVDHLRVQADAGEKVLHWFELNIHTEAGETVARYRKQLYIRRKPPKP